MTLAWYFELRNARLRDPPADWFVAAEHKYEVPEYALARRGQKVPTKFSKAVENSLRMLEALEAGMSLPGMEFNG